MLGGAYNRVVGVNVLLLVENWKYRWRRNGGAMPVFLLLLPPSSSCQLHTNGKILRVKVKFIETACILLCCSRILLSWFLLCHGRPNISCPCFASGWTYFHLGFRFFFFFLPWRNGQILSKKIFGRNFGFFWRVMINFPLFSNIE